MDQKKETAQAAEKKQAKSEESPAPYTAVVYFHGMGSQRRYEEVSRLVDCLDHYAGVNHEQRKTGLLREIKAYLETCRNGRTDDVSYLRVTHIKDNQRPKFRFYEVYWAPLMAGAISTKEVVKWVLARLATPVRMGKTPWRLRPRVKRSALFRLWADHEKGGKNTYQHGDLHELLEDYDAFEGQAARQKYPKGGFRDFLAFLSDQHNKNNHGAALRGRIVALAKEWRSSHNRAEMFTFAMLLTFFAVMLIAVFAAAVAAVGVSGLALAGLVLLLKEIGLADSIGIDIDKVNSFFLQIFGLQSNAPWSQVFSRPDFYVILALSLFTLLGLALVRTFLRDYVGDVQLWTTYEETNEKYRKRKEVLKGAFDTMAHVLLDEACERVVVIGHSLGTTIAHDTLLELGRYNRARHNDRAKALRSPLPLHKIEHFITLGSPIDKVHYFFESHKGKHHRYNRVVEEVRGDLGEVPFASNRKPHIHWINIWDRADLVSSSLETPCNKLLPDLKVDNFEISSYYFPDPVKSHSAYFEHAEVISIIFDVIFNHRYSYKMAPREGSHGAPNYSAQNVGPGTRLPFTAPLQSMMIALPWLILGTIVIHLMRVDFWKPIFLYGTAFVIIVLLIAWGFSKMGGLLKPVKEPGTSAHSSTETTSSDVL